MRPASSPGRSGPVLLVPGEPAADRVLQWHRIEVVQSLPAARLDPDQIRVPQDPQVLDDHMTIGL
jgi:hypothetical protein